ncbi:hypothetical protein FOA52_006451 [Chlamydomonas sp. UWO 241]|nr:hypothetical protein FOA52_006451 [Chlamydomonas sp. UWO 241]
MQPMPMQPVQKDNTMLQQTAPQQQQARQQQMAPSAVSAAASSAGAAANLDDGAELAVAAFARAAKRRRMFGQELVRTNKCARCEADAVGTLGTEDKVFMHKIDPTSGAL